MRTPTTLRRRLSSGAVVMKLKIRRSNLKRARKVGFRTRSKTVGGRKIIKRKRARSGSFRVG